MTNQDILEELLKKKGIGPQGSKSLSSEHLANLSTLMQDDSVSITTRATMLTALLTLEPTEEENIYIKAIKADLNLIPSELRFFLQSQKAGPFEEIVRQITKGFHLTEIEARRAMELFFDPREPEFLKASFLEGERLKRETFTENKVFLEALWNKANRIETNLPLIIHFCDSYDGFNRSRNYTLFTAAALASLGFPCLVTGIDSVAPKCGYTHHQILQSASKNPLISMPEAVSEIIDTGWTYLDQQVFFPELYMLKKMRKEMVKRPFLATFEKLLQPIRSVNKNYVVTGYTHPHYKVELVKQLKEQGKTDQALVLKGMEGSTHMNLCKDTVKVHFDGKDIFDTVLNPSSFDLPLLEEKQDKAVTAETCFEEGFAALHGEKNYARENIIYLAASALDTFGQMEGKAAAKLLAENLDNGKVLDLWVAKK